MAAERSLARPATSIVFSISATSTALSLLDLQLAQVAVADQPRLAQAALGGDAGPLDLLARDDLGFLEGLPLGDLERLQGPLALDPGLVEPALARGALALDVGAGGDLGPPRLELGLDDLDGLRASAISRSRSAISTARRRLTSSSSCSRWRSMRSRSTARPRRDLLPLDRLAALELGCLDGAAARDLALLDLFLVGDPDLGQAALLRDAGPLGRLGGGDLGFLGLLVPEGPLAGQFGALHGAAHLDLALLFEPGIFALAVDLERPPLGIEVLVADREHGLLLDQVAHLAAGLDRLGQLRQAFGVEGVRRIEMFEPGLVEVDQRDAFEFQPVEAPAPRWHAPAPAS